ncbi:MAG: FHA domain-containing protein [Chloroflexi bacterium]|nr:FHA domain-containing protein [Chloroflexota bacterium]
MIQGDSFRLIVRRGPQPNQSYDLSKDIVTLGRDITNDIVINDPEVSRHHMRLTRGASGFSLEDLGSTNGTFVNGQRLSGARPLRPGDMIGLGETVTLTYEMVSAPRPMEDAPGALTSPSARPPASTAQPYIAPQPAQPQVQPQPQQYGGYQPPAQQQQGGYSQYNPPNAPVGVNPVNPSGELGTDYDPYAPREEGGSNTTRMILIGCVGLSLFCCCSSVLGLVLVDQLCLWDRIPIVYDILRALGYYMQACT